MLWAVVGLALCVQALLMYLIVYVGQAGIKVVEIGVLA
jgi:hypothetical protein